MRALQMATIDPATFLGLDEELGGVAPGRRATLNVLSAPGEWRPELVLVDGEIVARDGALDAPPATCAGRPGRGSSRRRVRAADRRPARRALRERGHQPPRRPRGAADAICRPCWSAATGRWITQGVIENFLDTPGFATTATTSLELLVLGTDPAAMARAAAAVAELGGGFAFDGGWSAPLEIDGLIAAGGYDRALAIERELTTRDAARGLPVPRSAVLPVVRLRRLPA